MNELDQFLKTLYAQEAAPITERLQTILPLLAACCGASHADALVQDGQTGDAMSGYTLVAQYPASEAGATSVTSARLAATADDPYYDGDTHTWNVPVRISGQPGIWLRLSGVQTSEAVVSLLIAQLRSSLQSSPAAPASPSGMTGSRQSLYQLNEDLLNARDPRDITLILSRYFNQAQAISYFDMQYNVEQQLEHIFIRHNLTQGRIDDTVVVLTKQFPQEERMRMAESWASSGNSVEIIDDLSQTSEETPMLHFFRQAGVATLLIIPVLDHAQRISQIVITWQTPRSFSEDERRQLDTVQTQISLVLTNIRNLENVQRQTAEANQQAQLLRTLNNLTSIASDTDETHLLQQAAEMLVMLTDVDHSGIALINPDGQAATVVAEYPDRQLIGLQLEAQGSTWDDMRENHRPIMIANVEEADRVAPSGVAAMQDLGISAVIFVPMLDLENELIGSVGLDLFSNTARFDDTTLDIAQTIVSQITLSLLRVRLLKSNQQQISQMQRLTQFSQDIQSILDYKSLLRSTLTQAGQVIPADYVAISIYDRETRQLMLNAEKQEDRVAIYEPATIMTRSGNPAVESASETQQPAIVSDLNRDGWWHPQMGSLRSLMVMPIKLNNASIGVMELGSKSANAYSSIDEISFRQMANQLAGALDNSKAYEHSLRQARNKNISSEIATKLQQQIDLDGVLASAIQELGGALGARRARIRLGKPSAVPTSEVE